LFARELVAHGVNDLDFGFLGDDPG